MGSAHFDEIQVSKPVFQNEMPKDEQIHAKRMSFYYEMCSQHCSKRGAPDCPGIDFCYQLKIGEAITNGL